MRDKPGVIKPTKKRVSALSAHRHSTGRSLFFQVPHTQSFDGQRVLRELGVGNVPVGIYTPGSEGLTCLWIIRKITFNPPDPMSEDSQSPQVRFILGEWCPAFGKKDLDFIAKHMHKDFRGTSYPQSLGQPEQTGEQWLEHFAGIFGLLTENKTTIHSVIDTPGKVILHVTANVKTVIGIETTRESIFIQHVVTDEDGSLKVKRVEEFTDSKTHLDFMQAVAAATAGKG